MRIDESGRGAPLRSKARSIRVARRSLTVQGLEIAPVTVELEAAARLAAVARSGLLGSPPQEAYDALTRMAASLLEVPASFVSIVDRDRDVYVSQVGFPEALAAARELRGPTFCHHVLDRRATLVIEDTHADPVWRAVPTVQTLGVRAYVGVPLLLDGEVVGSFCVIDVRPRAWKPRELAILEQLALSAGRELALRTALRDASDAAVQAKALVRAHEEMVAVVAHDLRTPLQVLTLSMHLLQRTCTPEQQPVMARMASAAESLKHLADELLAEHAALPAQGSRRERLSARQMLADVADTMALIAARAEIQIAVEAPDGVYVSVDYAQLLRVFCNLVGNALKHSPAGSRISLVAEQGPGCARLRVIDRGSGMSAAVASRAFERSFQGAEGLAQGDGIGLGLSIVKTLVERNGGQVSLTSSPGHGTEATVTLPLAAGPN